MSKDIFHFLICSERSGSNFITKILDNHPQVSGPSPVHLLRYFVPLEGLYGNLNINENWMHFLNDIREFFEKKVSSWNYTWNHEDFVRLSVRSLSEIFKKLYQNEADLNSKCISFVKENHAYKLVPYYLINFKESKFIWSYRDPRDMALSWKKDAILRGGVVRAANIWKEDQKMTDYLFDSLNLTGKIKKVSYENLIEDTEHFSQNICSFLNLEYNHSMSELNKSDSSVKNSQASVSWQNLNKGVMKKNSKKYQNELSENEIRFIEYICYDTMIKLGYKPDYPLLEKSEFLRIQYELSRDEKYDKPEYLLVPEEEKLIRINWTKCLQRIQNQFR